jgi:hypothetical protein
MAGGAGIEYVAFVGRSTETEPALPGWRTKGSLFELLNMTLGQVGGYTLTSGRETNGLNRAKVMKELEGYISRGLAGRFRNERETHVKRFQGEHVDSYSPALQWFVAELFIAQFHFNGKNNKNATEEQRVRAAWKESARQAIMPSESASAGEAAE